jgi:hypothetical protein
MLTQIKLTSEINRTHDLSEWNRQSIKQKSPALPGFSVSIKETSTSLKSFQIGEK